ncbi:MAG: hypothetical protein WDN69_07740 [Aliidongia sp.]
MRQRRSGAVRTAVAAALLGLVAVARPVLAEPFIPETDDTVLERLMPPSDPALQELRALAAAQRAEPDALALAIAYARRAVEFARRNGDPRYAGYAEAALRPWLSRADVPPAAAFMDAVLRQYRHDFSGALATLDALLAANPGDAETRLVRATVRQVTGDIAGAAEDCEELVRRADYIVVATCRSAAQEAAGQSRLAAKTLEIALALPAPPGLRLWALTLAAEQAARRGDPVKGRGALSRGAGDRRQRSGSGLVLCRFPARCRP